MEDVKNFSEVVRDSFEESNRDSINSGAGDQVDADLEMPKNRRIIIKR